MRIHELPQSFDIQEIKIKKTIKESFLWGSNISDYIYTQLLDNNTTKEIYDHFNATYKEIADCYPIRYNYSTDKQSISDKFDDLLKKYDFSPDWEYSTITVHQNGAYTVTQTFVNNKNGWGIWAEQSHDSLSKKEITFMFSVGTKDIEDLKMFEKELKGTILAITQGPPF